MTDTLNQMHKILVIDDDEDMLEAVSAALRKMITNAEVYTATSGKEGVEIAKSESPDVILLDIIMPEMDGFQVCKLLKVHEDTRHIPVITITAVKNDARSRVKGLESGADVFLSKPIDKSELAAQISAMLRIKKAEDQLRKEKEVLKDLVFSKSQELKGEIQQHNQSKKTIQQYNDIVNNMQIGLYLYHLEDIDDDRSLRLVGINPAAVKIIGLSEDDIVGKTLDENFPKLREKNVPQRYAEVVRTGVPIYFEEIFPGNNYIPQSHFAVRAFALPDQHVGILFEDITERKKIEEEIKHSLKEKELLLREVHHRVKNNLAMISSLLNIQGRYLKDKEASEAIRQSRKRIHTIALLHEKLYRSQDLTNIRFGEYIHDLAEALLHSSPLNPERCHFQLDIEDCSFSIDTIIPLGLIITELITNSLKYGSHTENSLTIAISLKSEKDRYVLTVSDNGPGIGEEVDWRNMGTLGLQLVITLTEQLRGRLELEKRDGASFKISFPRSNNNHTGKPEIQED